MNRQACGDQVGSAHFPTINEEPPMQINHLARTYRYDGIDLPIPPHLANDPQGLRAYHATLYPAILNAELVDAGVTGGVHVTEYRRAVGTKG